MDNLARSALTKILAAMDDSEFAALAAESRGVSGEQMAELTRSAEYNALQKQSQKSEAAKALRTFTGGQG